MKWYTYKIIDPRDASVFYVGKGTGRRAQSHLSCKLDHPKNHRIAEIRSQGYEPVVEHVAYFWEERHALDHEAEMIAEHEGLTNIAQNERPVRYIGLFDVLNDLHEQSMPPARAKRYLEGFLRMIKATDADAGCLGGFKSEFMQLCESYISLINHPVISKKLWPAH